MIETMNCNIAVLGLYFREIEVNEALCECASLIPELAQIVVEYIENSGIWDSQKWESLRLNVNEEEPPLCITALEAEKNQYILIPEGLSLERLEEAALRGLGNRFGQFSNVCSIAREKYWNIPSQRSYWIGIGNEGDSPATLLEACAAIFLQYLETGKFIYSRNPAKYICCEQGIDKWKISFGSKGLEIIYFDSTKKNSNTTTMEITVL